MELQRAVDFTRSENWQFAKTMPEIPHWYCVKNKVQSKSAFEDFVRTMETHGELGYFGKRIFNYFHLNGYKYWHCDGNATYDKVDLVNRDKYKKSIDSCPYEPVVDIFNSQEITDTMNYVLEILGDISKKRVLDVRCGDGLFKKIGDIENYIGVDNRVNYLSKNKETNIGAVLYLDQVKNVYLGKFDVIVSLLGEASELSKYDIKRMLTMCHDETRIVLMCKKEKPCRYTENLGFKEKEISNCQLLYR